jgi:hypothetical protein
MKRRLVWLLALAGLAWLWLRHGARRPEPVVDIPAPAPGEPLAGDPADELRRKLDETKERAEEPAADAPAAAPTPSAGPAAAPDADTPPAPAEDEALDAKRRAVHDRAQSAADEMRRSSSD